MLREFAHLDAIIPHRLSDQVMRKMMEAMKMKMKEEMDGAVLV